MVASLQKAGSTDTEKLIAAMEGLTFETPKGPMTFRKEDHQALQDMYHFRIKKDAKDNDVLELVATIPAEDMPLPIRNKKSQCTPVMPRSLSRASSASATLRRSRRRWIPATSAADDSELSCEGGMPQPVWRRATSPSASAATSPSIAVSAAFHAGTLTAIVGPNGAGKTTYFNLISGQLPATAGTVLLDGVDITRLGRGGARQARHRPRLPAHQPVSQPHRARERAAGRASRARAAAPTCSRAGTAARDWIERADQFIAAANLADKRDRRRWRCRTATSASSRWRS